MNCDQEKELFFKSIFENHEAIMILTDSESGKIIDVNRSAEKFYGYPKESFLKLSLSNLKAPSNGILESNGLVVNHKISNGETRTVEVHTSQFEMSNKKINFLIIDDITEYKNIKKSLEDSEKELRSFMENAQGFYVYRIAVDPNDPHLGNVVFVSPSITDIMGVTDLKNFSSWFEHFHPDDKARILAANELSIKTGKSFDESTKWYHPIRKEWVWLRSISKPIYNDKGQVTHFNGLCIDITNQKKAEAALEEKYAELEKINKLMIGREVKMAELKEKIEELKDKKEEKQK